MDTVSIRAPARGATGLRQTHGRPCGTFQSAPLREGRRSAFAMVDARASSFNPRPCARGDRVSKRVGRLAGEVSIRAPARGATRCPSVTATRVICFNPRPCARGD